MQEILRGFWESTGFSQLFQCNTELFGLRLPGELIMIGIACIFLYLAIKKGFEPYLLIPIAFSFRRPRSKASYSAILFVQLKSSLAA